MLTAGRPQAPFFIEHTSGAGAIARYHLDTTAINNALLRLRESGADGVSLSPWLLQNAVALGAGDVFLDWANGALSTQCAANFTALLRTMKSYGFNWVQVAPQFYGPNDFRNWTSWQEDLYQQNWSWLATLPGLLNAAGLPYLIDLCAEVDNGPYPQRLWTDWTGWFWPGGVPCQDATMSFRSDSASLAALPSVFSGNPPAVLAPHIYRGEQQAVYDGLQAAGLGGRPWVLAECYCLTQSTDQPIADAFRSFVAATRQVVLRVCPWQIDPRTPGGTQLSVFPPAYSTPWATAGF